MTRTIRTIIIAAMALAAASCAKEITADVSDSRGGNPTESGKITVNVEALMGDLSPVGEETKSSIAPVVRLTWEDTDVVYAYDATQCLGSLTVTPAGNGTSAKLSGEITSTDATKITLVHCNTADAAPAITDGTISFDLSNQGEGGDPFVVWGTLDNSNQTNITDRVVPFHFATSLMRITATGLDRNITDIDSVKVSGLNTVCKLFVTGGGNPSIGGDSLSTIKKIGADNFTKEDERTIFTVSVAFTQDSDINSRKIVAFQGIKRFGSAFSKALIDTSKSYVSVYAMKEADGSRGTIGTGENAHDYVYIAGVKWATQNIAVTESGKKKWKGQNDDSNPVKVPWPNSDENIMVGDYFQWATYEEFCGSATDVDKGLLIYTSFSHQYCVGDDITGIVEWKGDKRFIENDGPYRNNSLPSKFDKYQGSKGEDSRTVLEPENDVARILWGATWRMPTKEELLELCRACFIRWDDVSQGMIFYQPKEEGHRGMLKLPNSQKILQTGATSYSNYSGSDFPDVENYTSDDVLLFFPASGIDNSIGTAYLSSCLFSTSPWTAYGFQCGKTFFQPQSYVIYRYMGCSIRPVSD